MVNTDRPSGWQALIGQVIIVVGLLPGVAGCGTTATGPMGRLRGRITSEGVAVQEGTVCVYASELGAGGSADLGADGVYAIPEPLRPGRYSVAILPPSGPPTEDDTAASPGKDFGNLPPKYRDPQQSGLFIDIDPGDNVFDVNMTR
jgi:hypothetical protein